MDTITERIDNTTRIPPESLKAAPPAPRSVKIEISPRCNYRCGFCALRTREHQPKWDMDFNLFRRITREMRDAGVEEIGVFYLGESFMNPGLLVDCIRHLKHDIGVPYVFLTTNASMAFPEAVQACMEARLDSLKWSVNAADGRQFEKIMGVSKRLFRRALENIQSAWAVREAGAHKTRLYASSIRYDGTQQEKTEWHRIVLWGKQAESLQEYLTKGKQIYIEGRLQTRQWDDKDGNKRYTTEIRGDRVVLLGGGGGGGQRQMRGTAAGPEEPLGEPVSELTDDDIPF